MTCWPIKLIVAGLAVCLVFIFSAVITHGIERIFTKERGE